MWIYLLIDEAKAARAERDRIESERAVIEQNEVKRRADEAERKELAAREAMTKAALSLIDDGHKQMMVTQLMDEKQLSSTSTSMYVRYIHMMDTFAHSLMMILLCL
jgi:DNA-binding Xre family transcriptional regulator